MTQPDQSDAGGLLPEDHDEIRLVPDGVREAWSRQPGESTLTERERQSWREFLSSPEGRKWLRERKAAFDEEER
jgi:hypothetical protein